MLSGHWSSYVYFDKRKHELKQKYYVVNVKFAYFIALKENGFIYIFTPAYNVYFGVYTFRMYNVNTQFHCEGVSQAILLGNNSMKLSE